VVYKFLFKIQESLFSYVQETLFVIQYKIMHLTVQFQTNTSNRVDSFTVWYYLVVKDVRLLLMRFLQTRSSFVS